MLETITREFLVRDKIRQGKVMIYKVFNLETSDWQRRSIGSSNSGPCDLGVECKCR